MAVLCRCALLSKSTTSPPTAYLLAATQVGKAMPFSIALPLKMLLHSLRIACVLCVHCVCCVCIVCHVCACTVCRFVGNAVPFSAPTMRQAIMHAIPSNSRNTVRFCTANRAHLTMTSSPVRQRSTTLAPSLAASITALIASVFHKQRANVV